MESWSETRIVWSACAASLEWLHHARLRVRRAPRHPCEV